MRRVNDHARSPGIRRSTNFAVAALLTPVIIGLSSLTARADVTNARPVSPLGDSDIQTLFSNQPTDAPPGIYKSGPTYDAVTDQSPQAIFTHTASGGSVVSFVVEMTPLAQTNRFGLYDVADPTKKAMLFDGTNVAGDQTFVSFLADGRVLVFFADSGIVNFSGNFGFYVDVFGAPIGAGGDGNPTTYDYSVYSEDSRNLNDAAQALAYQGNDSTTLQIAPFSPGVFTDSDWIIAFEDGLVGTVNSTSDRDYSDFVVLVESITPLELPMEVPTVSQWGLVALTLLLLTGSKVFYGLRKRAASFS